MAAGFWTDIQTEPKRQFRWIINIGGIPQWIAKKASKPSFEIEGAEHAYINHTFKYPGRVKWQPISVTIVDPVDPDASKTLEDIMRAAGYHFPTDPNDVTTISKAGAVRALGRVVISQFGADDATPVEEWELINAWVKKVEFGELDYESDDLVEVTLELEYDFARIIKSGTPVPTANV